MKHLIRTLQCKNRLDRSEYFRLLTMFDEETLRYANYCARSISKANFGTGIYLRGLIEITSFCKNNCHYCGIRANNQNLNRYRLSIEQILDCCRLGDKLGVKTFVLQGGEDPKVKNYALEMVNAVRQEFPDTAITLSLGEWDKAFYKSLFDAGADRYLLRHEAADKTLYNYIHPSGMDHDYRLECLRSLQQIGYQTGTGMMIGVPGQTVSHLVEDLLFIERFKPQMVGIGPFIPASHTPYSTAEAGSITLTLLLISIIRLMLPDTLIPATTSLATLSRKGYEQGILAGANVIMPNLLPQKIKSQYAIYDNKACLEFSPEYLYQSLTKRVETIGYTVSKKRGDHKTTC